MADTLRPQPRQSAAGARPTPRNAGEMLALGKQFLEAKGRADARLEAELLVAEALELDRLKLFLSLDRPVTGAEVDRARDLLVRRAAGEPVAYLTGRREFYGRDFAVGPGVLVPRPETELLVDLVRARFRGREEEPLRIADLGTGSGCLAVTLAAELPGARVLALDVADAALEFAARNAEALGVAERVRVERADGVAGLVALAAEPLDALVCNPPYIDPAAPEGLEDDVRRHEPEEALFAPAGDPEHWVRALLEALPRLVRPNGVLVVELGAGQGPRALALARERGRDAALHRDLAGHERVLEVVGG